VTLRRFIYFNDFKHKYVFVRLHLKQSIMWQNKAVIVFKIEQLKSDLQSKDKDLLSLQTRLDTLSNQQSDSRQHIDVLKESLLTKEQGSALLQSEVT